MNEEVLQILKEPEGPYDSDIDLSQYDINELLEEEEVEIESVVYGRSHLQIPLSGSVYE